MPGDPVEGVAIDAMVDGDIVLMHRALHLLSPLTTFP